EQPARRRVGAEDDLVELVAGDVADHGPGLSPMAGHYRIIQAAAGNRRQGPVIAYTANPLNTPVAMPLPTHTDCIEISAPGGAGMLRPTRRPLPLPAPRRWSSPSIAPGSTAPT